MNINFENFNNHNVRLEWQGRLKMQGLKMTDHQNPGMKMQDMKMQDMKLQDMIMQDDAVCTVCIACCRPRITVWGTVKKQSSIVEL